jgi:hypothetical protein
LRPEDSKVGDGTATPMTEAATHTGATNGARAGLPCLLGLLGRARRRRQADTLLRGSVWSVLAGLAAFCTLRGAALFDASVGASPVAGGLGVFAGGLALTGLVAIMRAPSDAALARVADRAFGLKECLSTALEVTSGAHPGATDAVKLGPVRRALVAQAERYAGVIDPHSLIAVGLPRAAWAVPVLVGAAVLFQLVPPDALGSASPPGLSSDDDRSRAGLTEQQRADASSNLQRIAERIGKDADERSDPYLRTIARTLDRLSSRVQQAGEDRQILAAELEQLLQHTERAYGRGSAEGTGERAVRTPDPAGMLKTVLDALAGNRQTETAAMPPAERAAPVPKANPDTQDRAPPAPSRKAPASRTLTEALIAARNLPGADIPWLFLDENGEETDPRAQIERLLAEEERRARGTPQPAGAAADAGKGEGDRAGDGTRPLGRGDLAAPPDGPGGGDMRLPDQATNEGRRIRIEVTPDTARSDVAPPTGAAGDWRRLEEQPVERPPLESGDRDVVGRYFKRQAGGSPP